MSRIRKLSRPANRVLLQSEGQTRTTHLDSGNGDWGLGTGIRGGGAIRRRSESIRLGLSADAAPSPPAPLPQGERGDGKWRLVFRSSVLWLLLGLVSWSQPAIAQDKAPEATARAAAGEAGPAP